ncbi:hypothetical protein LLG95_03985 [bacterium]|nr:hypothetical protein [bacterium]
MKAINATAEIDSEGWLTVHTRLPEKMEAGPVEAIIVLQPGQAKAGAASKQNRIIECIRELRKLGPIAGMDDPAAWQRSMREDRDVRRGN